MIVKILQKPSRTFAGVRYNTDKIDRNKGELMRFSNFGALQSLYRPRPQDLINYLLLVASLNKRVSNTQFHAVISAAGKTYSKHQLADIAEEWLREMGYAGQPQLVVFHKDTNNNHVHMVTSRIDRNGKLINRAFEKVRSQRALEKVLGYTFAFQYRVSTEAQFYLVLERQGYMGREYLDRKKMAARLAAHRPDKQRAAALKVLFLAHKNNADFMQMMRSKFKIDIVLHAAESKAPYGYSVIDHATCQVFKGSEILPLKQLLDMNIQSPEGIPVYDAAADAGMNQEPGTEIRDFPTSAKLYIADDIDDEGVLGGNRRRKRKARTNTR